MDSLTHIVLGSTVGELILGKKAGKKAMFWGAVAGSAPDIDFIYNFIYNDVDSIVLHRGITHSLFTGLLAGLFFGWLLWRLYKKEQGTLSQWMFLTISGIYIHNLLDTCTMYGTGLLLPFSNERFSFNNIFVADPLYTLPLIISFVALLATGISNRLRKAWAFAGIAFSTIYLGFTLVNHHDVTKALHRAMKAKGKPAELYFVTPTLFNNILWNVVAKDSTGFWVGYYSILDKTDTPELFFIPQNEHLMGPTGNNPEIKKLKEFSKGFYCITGTQEKWYFNDLRFGQVGGWINPQAEFAFSFDFTEGADNSLVVQKGRIEGSRREALTNLWQRILGI